MGYLLAWHGLLLFVPTELLAASSVLLPVQPFAAAGATAPLDELALVAKPAVSTAADAIVLLDELAPAQHNKVMK